MFSDDTGLSSGAASLYVASGNLIIPWDLCAAPPLRSSWALLLPNSMLHSSTWAVHIGYPTPSLYSILPCAESGNCALSSVQSKILTLLFFLPTSHCQLNQLLLLLRHGIELLILRPSPWPTLLPCLSRVTAWPSARCSEPPC